LTAYNLSYRKFPVWNCCNSWSGTFWWKIRWLEREELLSPGFWQASSMDRQSTEGNV